MSCAVESCKNKYLRNKRTDKHLFYFPKEKKQRQQWLEFLGKSELPSLSKHWRVCEDHFNQEDVIGKVQCKLGIQRRVALRQGAVPSILNIVNEENSDAHRQIVNNLDHYKLVELTLPDEVVENQLSEVIPLYEDEYSYEVVAGCSTDNQTEDRVEQDPLGDAMLQYSNELAIELESSDDDVADFSTGNQTEDEVEQLPLVGSIVEFTNQNEKTVNVECTDDDGAHCSAGNQTETEVEQQPMVESIVEYSNQNEKTLNVEGTGDHFESCSTGNQTKKDVQRNLMDEADYKARSIEYRTEIEFLKLETKTLQRKYNQLTKTVRKNDVYFENTLRKKEEKIREITYLLKNMEERLKEIFTEGQIERLQVGKMKQWWSQEDIILAKKIYSASPKFYKLLMKNNYPWPSTRTLQRINQMSTLPTEINDEPSETIEQNL